ncbi:MAG TPA: carboxypeptidase-like regulatory domain-containing protein [Bryobacteraceae bacterium]|nr:carboxypeptidase-like regulatory domain-containing protein [Bryobacteraceae bacterium]
MRRALMAYFLAAAGLAQIQQPPPMPVGKGSIGGVVTDGARHAPLKKVLVTVIRPGANTLTAVTDAGGRFVFHDLAPGDYWLNASKPGYDPPQAMPSPRANAPIQLKEDEQKRNVEISLVPGGTIAGKVVNQEGAAVRGCNVTAVPAGFEKTRRGPLAGAGGTATNDTGDYRISNLAPGNYYVFAHCQTELPAAHALLPRGDPRTPHETYLPQFYGGGLDPAAGKLSLPAGANLDSVDFQVVRAPAFTLRGSVAGGDQEVLAAGVNIMLLPANRLLRNLMSFGAATDAQNHTFEIPAVVPGSYVLFAFAIQNGRQLTAQRIMQVGASQPDPLEISISSGAELQGSVQFDCDDHPPFENGQVMVSPLDAPPYVSQVATQIDRDGAFTLAGVPSGRWRLTVSVPGYAKSVSLGGQPVSPEGFQMGASTAGPLRIVMGCKLARVSVSFAAVADGGQIWAVIYPDNPDQLGAGVERVVQASGTGHVEFDGMPPGRYRVFATDFQNPWPMLERPDLLEALQHATAVIEAAEGGHVGATVEILRREDLERMLEPSAP